MKMHLSSARSRVFLILWTIQYWQIGAGPDYYTACPRPISRSVGVSADLLSYISRATPKSTLQCQTSRDLPMFRLTDVIGLGLGSNLADSDTIRTSAQHSDVPQAGSHNKHSCKRDKIPTHELSSGRKKICIASRRAPSPHVRRRCCCCPRRRVPGGASEQPLADDGVIGPTAHRSTLNLPRHRSASAEASDRRRLPRGPVSQYERTAVDAEPVTNNPSNNFRT